MLLVFAAHGLIVPPLRDASVIARSRLTNDATETDMAGRGVHRLGMTRGRTVAAAIIRCTQVRAAFQHLTRNLDFGLARVVARVLTTAPRIDRDAAGLVSIG